MSKINRKRKNLEFRSEKPKRFLVFSLKDFDVNQGQSFKKWEEEKILSNLMERLRALSSYTIQEAQQQKILTIYNSFHSNSEFSHPKHVPEGVKWAKISIQGKERIAGYVEDNVFFIVFFDKDHKFLITEKKHT